MCSLVFSSCCVYSLSPFADLKARHQSPQHSFGSNLAKRQLPWGTESRLERRQAASSWGKVSNRRNNFKQNTSFLQEFKALEQHSASPIAIFLLNRDSPLRRFHFYRCTLIIHSDALYLYFVAAKPGAEPCNWTTYQAFNWATNLEKCCL